MTSVLAAPTGTFDWSAAPLLGESPGVLWAQPTTSVDCLRVDLSTPGLRLVTTGRAPGWVDVSAETVLKNTAEFVVETQSTSAPVVAAINADAFGGNSYGVTGLRAFNVAGGTKVSSGNVGGNAATMILATDGSARMQLTSSTSEPSLASINLAVSGFSFVLVDGIPTGDTVQLASRTGLGLSIDGRYLFMFTHVGGNGITQREVGDWLRYFGARRGINMDGGGSSQMVRWNRATSSAEYLSARQTRLVGNNLGIYYETDGGLPLPWSNRDIGLVGVAGTASLENGAYTVSGAGAGPSDAVDAFRFAYRLGPRWTTTGAVGPGPSAHLVSHTVAGAQGVAGVMVRDDRSSDVTDPGARFAFVGRRGDGRAVAYWRTRTKGRLTRAVSPATVPLGSWFRIRRTTLYTWALEYSRDGSNWLTLAEPTIDMGQAVVPFSGLAVSSGTSTTLSTAVFDNVVSP